jgi:hypothetical protein
MSKFDVKVRWEGSITVDAESEEEAITRAKDEATPDIFDEFDAEVIDGPYEESDEPPADEDL